MVLGTDVGIALQFRYPKIEFGTPATIIRAFRIMRVIRLIKISKNLKVLMDTLVYILPSLANIGSLVFLLMYIYAVLGISIFSGTMH